MAKLYLWFVVPVYEVRPQDLFEMSGISLLVSYITNQRIHDSRELTMIEKVSESLAYNIAIPSYCLLIGFIIKQFLP